MLSLSAVGAKIEEVGSGEGRVGVGSGKGVPPTAENFCIFLFQNGEFLCTPAWISVWYFLPFRVMPLAVTNQII